MWIVENFSKEATEARNYEEKEITAFNIKNAANFFFFRLLGKYIEQEVHILTKTANDKK